jgi:hypothetical protein
VNEDEEYLGETATGAVVLLGLAVALASIALVAALTGWL